MSTPDLRREIRVPVFDRYGTVVDTQTGATGAVTPFSRRRDGMTTRMKANGRLDASGRCRWGRECPGSGASMAILRTAFVVAAVAACAAGDGSSRIVTGNWGGRHIGLVLDAAGGTLEYDCAAGRIEGPLSVDSLGRFSAEGYHTPGTGGPEQQGYVPPRLPALYSGRVSGDAMTLSVRVPSTDVEIGPLSLRRNAEPIILRCL